jgi:hypothetical protein
MKDGVSTNLAAPGECALSTPMPGELALEVAALPMEGRAGGKSLDEALKTPKYRKRPLRGER